MPSARVHVPTSAIAGAGWSLHEAREQSPQHQLLEGVAGTFGGALGGRAPDALDPPTAPNHRGRAHSAALGATLLALRDHLRSCADSLRAEADRWDADAAAYEEWSLDWVACKLIALVLRALVGFLNGFCAGYLCHLGLDIWTPAGIPIV